MNPGSEHDGNNFEDTVIPEKATCKTCKEGAECTNGLIKAKNGWWRPNPKTLDSFYKCKTPVACLGKSK